MIKENIGAILFAGAVGTTAIVSSGVVFDFNTLLGKEPPRIEQSAGDAQTAENVEPVETVEAPVAEVEPAEPEVAAEPEAVEEEVAAVETPVEAEPEEEVAAAPVQEEEPALPAVEETVEQQVEVEEEVAIIAPGILSPIQSAPSIEAPAPQIEEEAAEAAKPIIPTFDILRVEPDGSVLIAGVAAPSSTVELVTGSNVLTTTTSTNRGEFVAVLDEPLEPGDYQIVLRSIMEDGSSATSEETAIVSIPEAGSNNVLALVEAPGAPSRLISQNIEQPEEQETEVAAAPEAEPEAPAEENVEVAEQTDEADRPVVRIEAVEIDGPTVFVAGQAEVDSRVRVYANEILLGDTITNEDGRFLVQVNRDLPVGDYLIRADQLAQNGVDVVSRAAVPFTRSEGAKLAAVAVPASSGEESAQPEEVAASEPETVVEEETQKQAAVEETPAAVEEVAATTEEAETVEASQTSEQAAPATETAVVSNGNLNERLAPTDASVIIRRGDTLWEISRRTYGQGIKYTTIYQANDDQIEDPDRIWPGQIFTLPAEASETEN